jgi:hypothetical protein
MICRTCNLEFERKLLKLGYINQCDDCAIIEGDVETYAGRMGEKCIEMDIFRSNLIFIKEQLQRENKLGMSPNLNISSTTYEPKK